MQQTNAGSRILSGRGRRVAFFGLVAMILVLTAVFVWIPRFIESQIVDYLGRETRLEATIERIRFDPFRLRVDLEGVQLFASGSSATEPRESVLDFDALVVNVDAFGLFSADLALDEIRLVAPQLLVEVDDGGELVWVRLLTPPIGSVAEDESQESESDPFVLDIDRIAIDEGGIVFRDPGKGEGTAPFEVVVSPLSFSIEQFSTRVEADAPVRLTAQIGKNGRLGWEGRLSLSPLRSEGELKLESFDLRVPWQYASDRLRFEVASGDLEITTRYSLANTDAFDLDLTTGSLAISDLAILDRVEGDGAGRPSRTIVQIPQISLAGIAARVRAGALESVLADSLDLQGGELLVARESDGSLQLADLFSPRDQQESPSPQASTSSKPVASTPASPPGPDFRLGEFVARNFEISFEDLSGERPVSIELNPLTVEVRDVDLSPGSEMQIRLEASLSNSSEIRFAGPVRLEPLRVDLEGSIEGLVLRDFEPYWWPRLRVETPSGRLTSAWKLHLERESSPEGGGAGEFSISGSGRAQIDDLEAVVRDDSDEFLGWRTLRLEGIDFSNQHLHLKEVGLEAARLGIEIAADGRPNFARIPNQPGEAAAGDAALDAQVSKDAGPDLAFRVDRVLLTESSIRVLDRMLTPPFKAVVDDLGGSIDGLSSDDRSRAKVDLEARLDGRAPISIEGELNLLGSDAFTDLAVVVDGISMASFSPYAGRHVRYGIDDGLLGLRLAYKLENRTLEAKNRFLFERFSFGERVDGEGALSLPMPLPVAAALMKDAKGNIEINLPIRGNLDDPDFGVLRLIGKAFLDLLMKLATAPLSILGSVFGGGDADLSHVTFEAGSDRFVPGQENALATLIQVLADRPQLQLTIRGRADPERDGSALARARIEGELREKAFRALSRAERKGIGDPESFVPGPAARRRALEDLYRERLGARFADLVASDSSDIEAAEEKAMSALAGSVEFDEDFWQELAQRRAETIRAALVAPGRGLPAEQVSLEEVVIGPVRGPEGVPVELNVLPR